MPTPPPDFSVDVANHPGGVVVAPSGEVDIASGGEVRSACVAATGRLVLDLRGVEFLDTSGMNLLIECQRRADTDGFTFAVVPAPAHVQRLLDIGLNHRLHFVDDPAEALDGGFPAA